MPLDAPLPLRSPAFDYLEPMPDHWVRRMKFIQAWRVHRAYRRALNEAWHFTVAEFHGLLGNRDPEYERHLASIARQRIRTREYMEHMGRQWP